MKEKKKKIAIGGDIYEVKDIIGRKIEKGRIFYLVKWQGFPESYNTWEPKKNLEICPKLIKKFEAGRKRSMKKENRDKKGQKHKTVVKIEGMTEENKKLFFLVSYEDGTAALVDQATAHSEFPQTLIDFYEDRLEWLKTQKA